MNLGEIIKQSCKYFSWEDGSRNALDIQEYGLPKGISTGWEEFDDFFTILKGQLNILSGFPGSGKSEWIESMACQLAAKQNWKVTFFSPECYPVEFLYIKLAEKILNKQIKYNYNYPVMTREELIEALEFIKTHFNFVDSSQDDLTLERFLFSIENSHLTVGHTPDMVIIDPWNELEHSRPSRMTETDFIGESLKRIRKLARRLDISFWIVAHPTKTTRNKDGSIPKLSLYDISGSAHWYNKTDNGFIVERENIPGEELIVKVNVKKIKNRHYGKIGECEFKFIPAVGMYDCIGKYEPTLEEEVGF